MYILIIHNCCMYVKSNVLLPSPFPSLTSVPFFFFIIISHYYPVRVHIYLVIVNVMYMLLYLLTR